MAKSKQRRRPVADRRDTQRIEVLTVAWMLSVVTTLVCELAFAAARGYLLIFEASAQRIEVLAVVLLFAAFVIGCVSLTLGLFVIRGRRVAPPRGIVVFSIVVGAAPLTAMLWRLLQP